MESTAATVERSESPTRTIPSVIISERVLGNHAARIEAPAQPLVCQRANPGYLSREYFAGRRVRYIKPLQLFIFLNVVYYFSLTVFTATTFTTPLATQLHMNDYYPGYASRRVDHKLQAEKITYAALKGRYNKKPPFSQRP